VEDDAAQCRQVRTLFQNAIDAGAPCFVSEVVICEVVRVLEVSYRVGREEIARVLDQAARLQREQRLTTRAMGLPTQTMWVAMARSVTGQEKGRGPTADSGTTIQYITT
jgi:hypothetical protein